MNILNLSGFLRADDVKEVERKMKKLQKIVSGKMKGIYYNVYASVVRPRSI